MNKTIKKLILDDGWCIGRNECWFSDMAENGLHLQSIGRIFARFEKGEPRKTKYRIDVLSSPPTDEQVEVYKECGWEYVTNSKEFYIFSSPESNDCSELHTDPMEQGYTLTTLDKRLRNNLILISLLMLLFFGMMFSLLLLDSTLALSMTDGIWIQRPLLVLVELYVFLTVIRNFIAIRRLKNSLLAGRPLDHQENWKKHRGINGSIGIFFIIIACLTIVIPIIDIAKSEDYSLTEATANLPFIRLTELEQNPNLQREVRYNSRGVDWGNRVSYDWSIFAPTQYIVNEHGIVSDSVWEDKSGKYTPSIETRYYQLTFSQMADGLVHDLIERYVDSFDSKVTTQELESAFFDKLVVAEDGIRKQIFAYQGNKVIYVSYFGKVGAEGIITMLPQALTNFNKKSESI